MTFKVGDKVIVRPQHQGSRFKRVYSVVLVDSPSHIYIDYNKITLVGFLPSQLLPASKASIILFL
jgi:hypothetical protein